MWAVAFNCEEKIAAHKEDLEVMGPGSVAKIQERIDAADAKIEAHSARIVEIVCPGCLPVCGCVWQQRGGISTGLASSQSSSRKATLNPSRKASQTRTVRGTKHRRLNKRWRNLSAAVCDNGHAACQDRTTGEGMRSTGRGRGRVCRALLQRKDLIRNKRL